jgi:hypothetical protein
MRITVTNTPRYLSRLPSRIVLLRVIQGTIRLSDKQSELMNGGGLPVSSSDGIQNWMMPESDLWVVSDSGAEVEILLP